MCRDARIAQRIKSYCERGNDAFALSQLQAAALIPQLTLLPQRHQTRSEQVQALDTAFRNKYEWLVVPDLSDHRHRAFYKWAVFVRSYQAVGASSFRDFVLGQIASVGLMVGPGFHGFHRRSEQRCRKSTSLDNSHRASEATILLGHQCFHRPDLIKQLTEIFDYCDTIWNENTSHK